jgi:hypothetical protein
MIVLSVVFHFTFPSRETPIAMPSINAKAEVRYKDSAIMLPKFREYATLFKKRFLLSIVTGPTN